MAGLKLPLDPETDASLPKGGQLIGRLERLMILMLLLADQPDGIGLLIAAKSILRFNELAPRLASDRRASEYVIIGTLASFAWAIGTAWATAAALARPRPLSRPAGRTTFRASEETRTARACSAFPASLP